MTERAPVGSAMSLGGWLGIEDSNLGYLIQSQAAYH